jgi:hypothetical protein
MPFKYPSLGERVLANIRHSEDSTYNGERCWEWIGAVTVNRSGYKYGKLSTRYKRGPKKGLLRTQLAHRVAIVELGFKVLRARQVVMHLCNNTLCCNPRHLSGGTQRKNMKQCVADGRHVPGTKNQWGGYGARR